MAHAAGSMTGFLLPLVCFYDVLASPLDIPLEFSFHIFFPLFNLLEVGNGQSDGGHKGLEPEGAVSPSSGMDRKCCDSILFFVLSGVVEHVGPACAIRASSQWLLMG